MRTGPRSTRLALAAAALLAGLLSCGGPASPPRPPLPEGEGVYSLRLNRPPALVANPELAFEVDTAAGWERVALENPDDEQDLLTTLLAVAERAPMAPQTVDAVFRNDTRTYGEHTARVLRLLSLQGHAAPAPPSSTPSAAAPSPPSVAPSAAPPQAAPSAGG